MESGSGEGGEVGEGESGVVKATGEGVRRYRGSKNQISLF